MEGLNYHRYTAIKAHGEKAVTMNFRLKITASYCVTVFLAYCIMLVVMSFNIGAFITIIAGLTVGNFIFGYMKKQNQIKERRFARQL